MCAQLAAAAASAPQEPRRRFVADPKFGDVTRLLVSRGWTCVGVSRSDFELSWRNLRTTRFESLGPSQYVNHLQGSQVLSHKATLA